MNTLSKSSAPKVLLTTTRWNAYLQRQIQQHQHFFDVQITLPFTNSFF